MTPRSQSSSGVQGIIGFADHEATASKHNAESPPEHEGETRPRHTAEIGTLKKLSVGGTAWLGSSSGVYFVNTVRTAFSAAFASQTPDADGNVGDEALPASEDIITGEDAEGRNVNGQPVTSHTSGTHGNRALHHDDFHQRIVAAVGSPPLDQGLAMELVTTFFRQTHPLFPFLHGPEFLNDVKLIYSTMSQHAGPSAARGIDTISNKSVKPPNRRSSSNSSVLSESSASMLERLRTVDPLKLITFQIIINIAALSHSTTKSSTTLAASSTIHSAQALMSLILPLSTRPLLTTIQLLFAAELYLCSTISLRHSSTVAGLVLRLIYHTGLHRCPLRYAALTEQDCEIRKRVFWSAYALDRHLSLALGDPNTFQDSDIDVCLSRNGGEGELHRPVARDLLCEEEKQDELRLHYPRDSSGRIVFGGVQRPFSKARLTAEDAARDNGDHDRNDSDISARVKQLREAALTAYVHYGKLTGRIIEIFHKSINFRFPKEDAIGFLTADIENWWNDLPPTLTGDSGNGTGLDELADIEPGLIEKHRLLTPFFTLLYHQLLLLLNRPRLSLDQSTAEFQQGLQVCIRASRSTLSSLKRHKENGQSMFLPGLLSAAWMSGLIIAFACQLGKYPKLRACNDIKSCLAIIESMNMRWYTVKNCHKVLSLLLNNINSRRAISTGYLPAARTEQASRSYDAIAMPSSTRKRTLDLTAESIESEPSPKRASVTSASPQTSDFMPTTRSQETRASKMQQYTFTPPSLQHQDTTMSNVSSKTDRTLRQSYPSINLNSFDPSAQTTSFATTGFTNQQRAGAAVYADPQDIAFAQSSHSMGLPELSAMDDQMFWGNIDSNMFDVFGAVSWENMTGPVGPMANAYDVSSFNNMGDESLNLHQQRFVP